MEYEKITYKIIACAMEVHNQLGNGFQEVIYQRALSIELNLNNIDHIREQEMKIYYKNEFIGTRRVDFLVNGNISVEIKAVKELDDVHLAQALNYLETYNLQVGLLINFGSNKLQFKRLHNQKYKYPENLVNQENRGLDNLTSK